jgi:hypothetical protein
MLLRVCCNPASWHHQCSLGLVQMKLQQFDYNDGGKIMDSVAPKMDTAFDHISHAVPNFPLSIHDVRVRSPRGHLSAPFRSCRLHQTQFAVEAVAANGWPSAAQSAYLVAAVARPAECEWAPAFCTVCVALITTKHAFRHLCHVHTAVAGRVQGWYPNLLLLSIMLELLGGICFIFSSTIGAYMLARPLRSFSRVPETAGQAALGSYWRAAHRLHMHACLHTTQKRAAISAASAWPATCTRSCDSQEEQGAETVQIVLCSLRQNCSSCAQAPVQILFTVPVTLVMHDFWNEDERDQQEIEIVQFMKARPTLPSYHEA